jgi:hypothetical protein
MHLWSLILLVFLINFDSSDNATIHCEKDVQCNVTSRICADCVNPNSIPLYPSCTSAICINDQCGTLAPCSLKLSGDCTTAGDCITSKLCKKCKKDEGPSCPTARCVDKQCANIPLCSIPLQQR